MCRRIFSAGLEEKHGQRIRPEVEHRQQGDGQLHRGGRGLRGVQLCDGVRGERFASSGL